MSGAEDDGAIPEAPDTTTDPDPFFDASRDMPVRVGKRFEILGRLGSGGMGEVYRARDRELDEIVALKIISADLGDDPGQLERLRREVKLARRISSPRVCRIHDIVELADGTRGVTMQLVPGRTMLRIIRDGVGSDWRRRVRWAADVAEGLVAAHALGIVHRDLKPENVMIDGNDRAVILDFGVAYQRNAGAEDRLTADGIILGTLIYMAPEQLAAMPLDGRADLYALGLIIAESFHDEVPFAGSRYEELLKNRVLTPQVYELRAGALGAPAALDALVRALLAANREHRPSTAFEVMNDLRAIERGDEVSITARGDSPSHTANVTPNQIERTQRSPADRRVLLGGASVVVGALIAGAILFAQPGRNGAVELGSEALSTPTPTQAARVVEVATPTVAPASAAPTTAPVINPVRTPKPSESKPNHELPEAEPM